MALDVENCKWLRNTFGMEVVFTDDIIEWGKQIKEERERLTKLANAEAVSDETLLAVQDRLPVMWKLLRPDQKVGINYIAQSPNPLVADEPGLGKTLEVIGGIYQAGLADGPNLIICPKISIENVWLYELRRFQDNAIFPAPEGRKQREKFLEEVEDCLDLEVPFWLIVNPAMLTYRKTKDGVGVYDPVTDSYFDTQFPFIHRTQWNSIIIDEAQDSGIANASSQISRSLKTIKSGKRIATSGTPAGGKASRLWGILHWLEPKVFTSKTRWSEQWLVGHDQPVQGGANEVRVYAGIQSDQEERFFRAHAQYILRRKKEEVFVDAEGNPTFPPPIEQDFWVDMTPAQRQQYKLMNEDAVARIEGGGNVIQNNLLGVYVWLRQFANAYCDLVEKGQVFDEDIQEFVTKYRAMPTFDSPKLAVIEEFLSELDIPNSQEQMVVFTQFSTVADMLEQWFQSKGVPVGKITGKITSRQVRAELIDSFQAGTGPKVMVMTTKAGGVSINLDRADTCIHFDEEWDPDKKIQATNRIHRASRIHMVRSITIRTRGTIEEDVVMHTLERKAHVNEVLLDIFRTKGKQVTL